MDDGYRNRGAAAAYLLASKRCEILGLEHLLRMGQVVTAVSELVHAMQRERGISNLYVASGGERCRDRLPALVQITREAEGAFRDRLAQVDSDLAGVPGNSRLLSRIAYALHGLEELCTVRERVRELSLQPEAVIDGYSALVQSLLALVFEAADAAADPDVSRALVALFHLMQGKELAGQERAVGVGGFARGGFSNSLSERLRHLIDHQERCFQVFADFADQTQLGEWWNARGAEAPAELERLRRIAFSGAMKGAVDRALSDVWFRVTSERIDALRQIEDRVEHGLMALCRRRIAEARRDLESHRNHLDALTATPPDTGALAVFFDRGAAPGGEAVDTGCASPQLGRSLIDLVRSQSARLQTMSEELEQARAALADRKAIEKAKGLIMRHRRINEDQAYRFLREVAMAQSRKLADVARDTIAMSDIFRERG
ncbi:MAG: nitrate- and nitrite sensing domain-containing protein [Ectothiorhodospiraceae bacterium]|nr:nitrate- and nitrite sensing domain-containing protein [Ectothiorhodospiraceae bacterium]